MPDLSDLGRRTEVYSVRRPGASEAGARGYARCLDCDWWVGCLDPGSARRAADGHEAACVGGPA